MNLSAVHEVIVVHAPIIPEAKKRSLWVVNKSISKDSKPSRSSDGDAELKHRSKE